MKSGNSSEESSPGSDEEYVPSTDRSTEAEISSDDDRDQIMTDVRHKVSGQGFVQDSCEEDSDCSSIISIKKRKATPCSPLTGIATESSVSSDAIFISPVSKNENGSRFYDKKQYCLYCETAVQKMSRHLLRKHRNETDVAKALSFPVNSKERKMILGLLRNRGNHAHNQRVIDEVES